MLISCHIGATTTAIASMKLSPSSRRRYTTATGTTGSCSTSNKHVTTRTGYCLLLLVQLLFVILNVQAVTSQQQNEKRALFSLFGQRLKQHFTGSNSKSNSHNNNNNKNKHNDKLKQQQQQGEMNYKNNMNNHDQSWNWMSVLLLLSSSSSLSSTTTTTTIIIMIVATLLVVLLGYIAVDYRRKRVIGNGDKEDDEMYAALSKQEQQQKIDVAFEGIELILNKKKGKSRILLDGSISGRVQPGRMLAIMGPSGAGKSTVLHALAGRIKYNPALQLHGTRYVNGISVPSDSMIPAAFIEQDVTFFPYMTVRETLSFRVELKLGSIVNKRIRNTMVNDLLQELGLMKVADTIVGDQKVRGISGGERKRLSIAVEMIGSPSVIFLDEPTSGLDSTAANSLVQTLRELADSGKTVIAVIHQPNQHVFSKFDDILLVSEGKQMYFGPRQDVRSYMEQYGCVAVPETGTSEHILDCISRQAIGDETDIEIDERMERLSNQARQSIVNLGTTVKNGSNNVSNGIKLFSSRNAVSGPRANILVQFRLLLQRSLREVFRGKVAIILGLVRQISTALIFGGIYNIGTNQASIQDRFGLLSLIAIGAMNMAVAQTIRTFPREKAIVANELASNMYRTLPYFVGKAISELPMVGFFNGIFGLIVYKLTGLSNLPGKLMNFLGLLTVHGVLSQAAGLLIGSISPNSDVALAIFPAIVVLNIIFDGKNIAEESIPKLLRWIPNVGLIRWGYEGLCLNEFDGLKFDATGGRGGPIAKTGADALARFGLGTRSLKDVLRAQIYIASACWILSYIGFTITRQKYLTMLPPSPSKRTSEK